MFRPLNKVRKQIRSLLLLLAGVGIVFGNALSVSAASLNTASLQLGDPRTSQTSTYVFDASGFTTGTPVYCMALNLNTQADGAGSAPTTSTTSSTLDSSTLITAGNWTVNNSTDGTLKITNAAGEAPAANGNIVWGSVTNGATADTTYYGLFTTYSDVNCTGGNEVDTVTVAFIYTDGTLVSLTIDPTLTFTVGAVATSQSVNGATTTVGSSGSSIDFGNSVTTVANGVSAHDLGVTTNASGGYYVYLRHTALLTNANGDTISTGSASAWGGSVPNNSSPVGFPGAGNEAWGYTTEDTDLGQFQTNKWTVFTTGNELVMRNTAATAGSGETVRVGHQVGIADTTPAGTYQTTLIYTIVATY